MNRITAAEARRLSGPSIHDQVDAVYLLIHRAVAEKKHSVKLYAEFWTGGYSASPEWVQACDLLRADGYIVKFSYNETMPKDMHTLVEW